jgi:hypothetical protein
VVVAIPSIAFNGIQMATGQNNSAKREILLKHFAPSGVCIAEDAVPRAGLFFETLVRVTTVTQNNNQQETPIVNE